MAYAIRACLWCGASLSFGGKVIPKHDWRPKELVTAGPPPEIVRCPGSGQSSMGPDGGWSNCALAFCGFCRGAVRVWDGRVMWHRKEGGSFRECEGTGYTVQANGAAAQLEAIRSRENLRLW